MKCVSDKVGDPRILELLKKFLSAGYIDDNGTLHKPDLGTPQGGILSPLLANIVMDRLDKFMAEEKLRFDNGSKRRKNPVYARLQTLKGRTLDINLRTEILLEMRKVRRSDQFDPNFRRLKFIRYADDFIVMIAGSLQEAKYIRSIIKDILKAKCGLELNEDKTEISSMKKK